MWLFVVLNYLTGLFGFVFVMDEAGNLRFGQHETLTTLKLIRRFGDCPEVGASDTEWIEWLRWRQKVNDQTA